MSVSRITQRLDPAFLQRRVDALESKVKQVLTARSMENAIVGAGGFSIAQNGALRVLDAITGAVSVILDATGMVFSNGGLLFIDQGGHLRLRTTDGVYVVHFGTADIPDGSGRDQQIAAIGRDDGTLVLSVADLGTTPGHAHFQSFVIWDRAGNGIIADDTNSGEGLAYPFLDAGWIDLSVPTASTTSGSFTELQWAYVCKTHPRIGAAILAYTPAGTAGELRITWGGVQIGSPVSVPSNTFTIVGIDPAPWPGGVPYRQEGTLVLEGRVTSGAGLIAARGLNCRQRGS